jgi:hypothetical protein
MRAARLLMVTGMLPACDWHKMRWIDTDLCSTFVMQIQLGIDTDVHIIDQAVRDEFAAWQSDLSVTATVDASSPEPATAIWFWLNFSQKPLRQLEKVNHGSWIDRGLRSGKRLLASRWINNALPRVSPFL